MYLVNSFISYYIIDDKDYQKNNIIRLQNHNKGVDFYKVSLL